MVKKDRRLEFVEWATTIRDKMYLSGWEITYLWERHADRPEAVATVETTEGRQHAAIWMGPEAEWFARTPEDRRNAIVHEFYHIICRDQTDHVRLGLAGTLGQEFYLLFWTTYKRMHEQVTDTMATLISRTMPLPK